MRTRILIPIILSTIILLAFLQFISHSARALNVDAGWQTVAPGIEYQEFRAFDSDAYVARMDRNNPNVTIDSMIAQGRLSGGLEQVTGMFNRYEDTINYWGQSWGKRNDVVIAINGYYFGEPVEPPGVPWRGQIHSGWYAKRHDNNQNGSGFAWQLDRDAFIGECVYHQPSEQIITFPGVTTSTLKIADINTSRGDDQLILYTPQYDDNTLTDNDGLEVLVEMTRPTLILPPALSLAPEWERLFTEWFSPFPTQERNPEAEAIGYVRKILDGQGSTPIPFDHLVLSATGLPRAKLLENLQVDMAIGISQAINHTDKDDCSTPVTGKDWTKTYASIGGAFYFLEDGLINSFPGNPQATIKDPRTAIAYNEAYIFFIVVDGRNPGVSAGMNMAELGYFARETVGANFGIAQDGGGSSTIVVNGEVKNVPSDEITIIPCPPPTFPESVYLPLVSNSPAVNTNPFRVFATPATPSPAMPPNEVCYQGTQRYVANGMMMVVVDPMITSTLFTPGQMVTTTITANLRLGPGTNYEALVTLPAGSVGTVKDHFNNLDGILATGFNWWKVGFGGGQVGWISESVLTGGP